MHVAKQVICRICALMQFLARLNASPFDLAPEPPFLTSPRRGEVGANSECERISRSLDAMAPGEGELRLQNDALRASHGDFSSRASPLSRPLATLSVDLFPPGRGAGGGSGANLAGWKNSLADSKKNWRRAGRLTRV